MAYENCSRNLQINFNIVLSMNGGFLKDSGNKSCSASLPTSCCRLYPARGAESTLAMLTQQDTAMSMQSSRPLDAREL